jgi:hypothetical protein
VDRDEASKDQGNRGSDSAQRYRVHRDIAVAQRALVEARGRLLEAGNREDLAAVLSSLRRAAEHVDGAIKGCGALVDELF